MDICVVIPTLNEREALAATVATARDAACRPFVLVVSDCGSTDGTADVAHALGARVVTNGTSRAHALNNGARAAPHAEVYVFLHADTRLPAGWDDAVRRRLDDPRYVGGAFDFRFGSHPLGRGMRRKGLQFVQALNRGRFRITGNHFGDQAIFCRRGVFEEAGGFDRVGILEDARFSRKLRRSGLTAILQPPVKTSPRRFVENGVWRTLLFNLALMARDLLGVPVTRQRSAYADLNTRGHTVATYAPGVTPPPILRPAFIRHQRVSDADPSAFALNASAAARPAARPIPASRHLREPPRRLP